MRFWASCLAGYAAVLAAAAWLSGAAGGCGPDLTPGCYALPGAQKQDPRPQVPCPMVSGSSG